MPHQISNHLNISNLELEICQIASITQSVYTCFIEYPQYEK